MNNLRYKLWIWLVLIIMIASTLIYYLNPFSNNVFPLNVILIAFIIIALLVVFLIRKSSYLKILKVLDADCDPDLFLKKAEKIINSRLTSNANRYFFKILSALALTASGNNKQAYDELKQLDISRLKKYLKAGDLTYWNMLLYIFLDDNKLDEANIVHNKLIESAKIYTNNNKLRSTAERFLNISQAAIDFKNKEYEKCLDYYKSQFDYSSNSLRIKINYAYRIGIIYFQSDTKKAEGYFNYVITHGNKLHVVQEAQEQLKLLITNNANTNTV